MSDPKITCGHPERKFQAKGMCQQCYLKDYYDKNRERYRYDRETYLGKNHERVKAQHRAHYANNKERYGETRRAKYASLKDDPTFRRQRENAYYRCSYGISFDEYTGMLREQQGKCAICRQRETAKHKNGKVLRLAVDHDHATNVIRGLLCKKCNTMLGHGCDKPALLRAAAAYLEKQN